MDLEKDLVLMFLLIKVPVHMGNGIMIRKMAFVQRFMAISNSKLGLVLRLR